MSMTTRPRWLALALAGWSLAAGCNGCNSGGGSPAQGAEDDGGATVGDGGGSNVNPDGGTTTSSSASGASSNLASSGMSQPSSVGTSTSQGAGSSVGASSGTAMSQPSSFSASATSSSVSLASSSAGTTSLASSTMVSSSGPAPSSSSSAMCPTAGTLAGEGCDTLGAVACDAVTGWTVACVGMAACQVWVAGTDCPAGGLECGAQGTPGVCECPVNGGTDLYVDSDLGSDNVSSGARPTGVLDPPQCRFGSLTYALSQVFPGGQVIATGASPSGMTFTRRQVGNSETFPIIIPDGVTLTTTDVPASINLYRVVINGEGGNEGAVRLSDGSSVSGFTFTTGPSANVGNPLLGCAVGSVDLHDVALVASQGSPPVANVGLDATGSCVVTWASSTVTGFASAGLRLDAPGSSPGTSTLTALTFSSNLHAIQLRTGSLSSLACVVTNSTGSGIRVEGGDFVGQDLDVNHSGGAGIDATGILTPPPNVTLSGTTSIHLNGNGMLAADGITFAGDTLTLNGVTVGENGASGVRVTQGNLDALGGTFNANGPAMGVADGAGIRFASPGTLNLQGVDVSSNHEFGVVITGGGTAVVTGGTFTLNARAGLHVNAGATQVTLDAVNADDNGEQGLLLTNGTVTVNPPSTFDRNGLTGVVRAAGIRAVGGLLDLATSGTTLNGNGTVGLHLAGATANVQGALIQNNSGAGVWVDSEVYRAMRVGDCTVSTNGGPGVALARAPPSGNNNALQLVANTVDGNTGYGIATVATGTGVAAQDISVTLQENTISNNVRTGVYLEQPGGKVLRVSMNGNDIYKNRGVTTGGATSPGGVDFVNQFTLTSFHSNLLHDNAADQMVIRVAPNNGASFNLDGVSCNGASSVSNRFWCHPGGVGLRTPVSIGFTNAMHNSWDHDTPLPSRDYGGSVNVTPWCTFAAPPCLP